MLYCSLRLLVLVRHHTLQKCCIVRYVYWFLSVTTHYRNVVLFATSTGSCPSPHIIEMLYCSLRLLVLVRHHTLQKCCIVRYVYRIWSVTTHYRNVILFATSTGSCPSPHIIEMLCCSLCLLVLVRHHIRNVVLFATSTGSCPSPHIVEMLYCSLRLLVLVRHHTLQKCCIVRYVYWFLSVTTHYRNVVLFATSTGSCPSPHIIEMLYCSLRLPILVRHLHIIEMLYCSLRLLVLVRHHTLQKCCVVRYVYWFLSVTTHYRNVVLFATSTGSCPSPHIIEMLCCSLRLLVLVRHHTLQKCCIVRYVYWFLSVTTHYRNVVLFATSTGSCPSPHIIEMLYCSLRLLVLVRHHTLQKCCIVRYVYWFLSVTTHYRNVVLFATSTDSCPSLHIIEMLYCSLRLLVLVRHHTLQKCCIVRYVYWFLSVTTHYRNVVLFATSTGSCPSPHIIEMLYCSLRLLVLVRHHTLQKCCIVRYVYWFLSVTTHYRNVVLFATSDSCPHYRNVILFATSTGSCPSPHIIEMLCCSLRLLVLVRHHTLQKCCVVRYVYWFLSVTTHYRNVVLFATSTGSCPSPHIIEMLYCSLRLLVLVRHHTLQKCCIVRYVYWFLSVTTHYRNVVLFATSTGSCPSPHIIEMLYCSLRLLVLVRHHTLQKCCIVRYVYWFLSVTTHYRNVNCSLRLLVLVRHHIIEMLYCSLRLLVLVRHHTLQKCYIVRYVYWFLSVTTHYRNVVLFATSTGSCPSPHIIEMLYCSLRLLVLLRHHTLQKCCIVRYVYWFLSVTTHYRNVILFATSTGSCPSPHIIEMLYCSLRLLVLVRHHTLQKCCVVRYVYWFLSVTTHYRNVVLFATSTGSCPSPHIIEMLYCSLRLLVLVRHHTLQKCCIVRYVYWFLSVTTHYRNVVLFATSTGSCPSPHIIEMLYCSLRLLVLVRHHTLQKCCIVRYVYWFLSVTTHYRNVILFATSTGSCPSPHIIEMLCCSLRLLVLVRHHTLQKCCIVRYVYWFLSVTTHYRNVVLFATSTGSCPSPHIIEMLYCSLRLLVLVRHHTLQKCCIVRYVYWFLSVTTHYRNVVLFATILVRHYSLQKCYIVRYVYWFLSVTTHYRNVVLFATSTGSCPSPHIIEMLCCSLRLLVLVRHHTLQKCCVVRYVYWFLSVTTHYRNVILFATSTGSCPSPHIIEMLYCSLRLLVLVRHHTLQTCCIVRYVYWFLSVTTHYRNVVLFATSTGSCPSPHIIEMLYCSLRLLVLVRHHTLQKCCIVRYVYWFLSVTTHYRNVVLFATSTGSCPSPHIIEMLCCSLRLLVLVRHHTLQKCCIVRYVYWFLSVTTHYRNVILFATSTGSCPSPHIIEMLYCSLRLLVLVRHHTLQKCCIVRYVYWFLSVTTHYRNVVLFATSTGSCPSPHIIEMLYCSLRLLVLVRHHTLQKCCIVRYVYWFLSVTTHYRNVVLFATSTGSCPSPHIIEMLCCSLRLLVLVRHHTLQKCCVVRYVYWFLSVTTHYRNVVLFATSTGSCPSPHIIEMLYCSLRLLVLVRHHTLQKCCIVRYVYWFLSVTTHYRNVVLFATSTGSCPSPHIIEMLYCSLRLLVLVRHHTLQKCCIVRYVYWFLSVTTHYRNVVLFATSMLCCWFLSVTTHYRNVILFATSTGSCPSPHIIEMLYCSLRLLVLVRHHTLQKCCIVRYVYWFFSVTTHYRNVVLFATSIGSCPSPHIIEMLYCSLRLLVLVRHHTLQKCYIVRYVYWFLSVTTHYEILYCSLRLLVPSPHIIEMLCCSLRLLVLVRHHTLQKCCIVRYVYWFLSVTTHYRNVVLFATSTGSCPSPHIIEMLYCSLRLLVLVRHHTLQKCCIVRYVYWFLSVTTHYRNVVLFATSTGSCPSPHIIEMLYCSLRLLVLVRHHTLQKCCIVRYVYVTTHYRNVILFATSTGSCPSPHIIEMLCCSLRLLVLVRHHTLQKCCIVRYVYWFLSVTTHYRNVVLFATSTGSCPSPHIIEMLYCSLRLLVLVRHHTLQKCCIVRYVYWFLSVTTHYRNVVLFATSTGSCPSPHIIEMLYCSLRLLVLVRHHTLQKCCVVRYVYWFLSVTTHYRNVVLFATSTGSCPSPHIIEMLCCSLRLLVLVRHHTLQKCYIVRYVYWFLSVTTHYRNVVLFATSTGSCPSPHIIDMLYCSLRLLVLVRHHTLQKCCIVRYVYWFLSVTTHYRNVVLFATSTGSCPSPHIIEMLYCSLRLLVLVRHHTLQKCCVVRNVYSCPSPHIIEMLYCSLRLLVLVRHHTLQKCCIVRYVYWFLSVTTHYRNVVLFATSTGSCPSPHIIEMLYCSLRLLVLVRHHTLQKCYIVRYVYWFLSVTTHYRNVILFATSTGSCPSPHIMKFCIVRYVYWFLSVTTHYRNVVLFATSTGSCPSPHIIEMLYCSLRLLVLVRHHTLQKCCVVRYVYWFLSVTTHYRNVVLFATSTGSCPSPHIIEMLYCSLRLLVLVRHHTLQKCCIVRYVYWFLSVTTHYRNVVLFATSTGSCPSPHIIEMLYCSLRLLVLVRHHTLQKCCIVRYVYWFLSVTTHYRNVVLFATSTGSCGHHTLSCCIVRYVYHTLQKCCIVRYVYWFLSVTTHYRNVVLFATSTGSCPSPHIIEMLYCSLRLLVLVRHHTLQKC